MPPRAPTRKVPITGRLYAWSVEIRNSYWLSKRRMNAPEIPGRIMAQMATAPEIRIMGSE